MFAQFGVCKILEKVIKPYCLLNFSEIKIVTISAQNYLQLLMQTVTDSISCFSEKILTIYIEILASLNMFLNVYFLFGIR